MIREGRRFCDDSCFWKFLFDEFRSHGPSRPKASNLVRLGTILVQQGKVDREATRSALKIQKSEKEVPLGRILVRQGRIREADVTAALSRQYGLPVVSLQGFQPNRDLLSRVPPELAVLAKIFPIAWDHESHTLSITTVHPSDLRAANLIRRYKSWSIRRFVADESSIYDLIALRYLPSLDGAGSDKGEEFSELRKKAPDWDLHKIGKTPEGAGPSAVNLSGTEDLLARGLLGNKWGNPPKRPTKGRGN